MLLFGLTVICMIWMHYAIKQQQRLDGQVRVADVDATPIPSSHS